MLNESEAAVGQDLLNEANHVRVRYGLQEFYLESS